MGLGTSIINIAYHLYAEKQDILRKFIFLIAFLYLLELLYR